MTLRIIPTGSGFTLELVDHVGNVYGVLDFSSSGNELRILHKEGISKKFTVQDLGKMMSAKKSDNRREFLANTHFLAIQV